MSQHQVTVLWRKASNQQESYIWRFDNGLELNTTPVSDHAQDPVIDPESAFVASISSCHMLSLMAIAVKQGYCIRGYKDTATGLLKKNHDGRIAITDVLLRPEIEFVGDLLPNKDDITRLHETAHRNCFIANSVNSVITIEPVVS